MNSMQWCRDSDNILTPYIQNLDTLAILCLQRANSAPTAVAKSLLKEAISHELEVVRLCALGLSLDPPMLDQTIQWLKNRKKIAHSQLGSWFAKDGKFAESDRHFDEFDKIPVSEDKRQASESVNKGYRLRANAALDRGLPNRANKLMRKAVEVVREMDPVVPLVAVMTLTEALSIAIRTDSHPRVVRYAAELLTAVKSDPIPWGQDQMFGGGFLCPCGDSACQATKDFIELQKIYANSKVKN